MNIRGLVRAAALVFAGIGVAGIGVASAGPLAIYPGAVAANPPAFPPVVRCGHRITILRYRGPAVSPSVVANWYAQRIPGGIQMNLNRTVDGDAIVAQAVMDPNGARAVMAEKMPPANGVATDSIELVTYDPPESQADIARLRAAAAGNQPIIAHIHQACGFF